MIYASRAVEKGASLADLGRAWQVSRQGARHCWSVLKRRIRPDIPRQRPDRHYRNGAGMKWRRARRTSSRSWASVSAAGSC
ncbi:hypothetical protein GCM10010377_77690 [Streptomyces viridiviolaceus]|nr:hypothetical protein GCM10010377_77690 [Streptomyces viridiviolaceus]